MNRNEKRKQNKALKRQVSQQVHSYRLGIARRKREAEALERRLSRLSPARLVELDKRTRTALDAEKEEAAHDSALD